MRRFKSTIIALTTLTLMTVGLMLTGCGSGGGSESGTSPQVLSGDTSVVTPSAGQVDQSSPNPSSDAVTPVSTEVPPTTSVTVSKQLSLAWDPVAGATSYNLYWSTVPGVTTVSGTKISGISSPSYVHTGLAAGTTYYYIVTAANSASESAASLSASGTTAL
jgi:fibronectin type 3 domain-containing protein